MCFPFLGTGVPPRNVFFLFTAAIIYLICFYLFPWSNSVLGLIMPIFFLGEDLRLLEAATEMISQKPVSGLTPLMKVKLHSFLVVFLRKIFSPFFLPLSLHPLHPVWCSRELSLILFSSLSAPCKSIRFHTELVYLLYGGIQSTSLPLTEIRPWLSLKTPSTAPAMPSSLLFSPCVCLPHSAVWSICGSLMWFMLSELSL